MRMRRSTITPARQTRTSSCITSQTALLSRCFYWLIESVALTRDLLVLVRMCGCVFETNKCAVRVLWLPHFVLHMSLLALLAATALVARAIPSAEELERHYTPTPSGYVLSHCVHNVRPAAHATDGDVLVLLDAA